MTAQTHPWWHGPAAIGGAALIRLLGATWRVEWEGLDPLGGTDGGRRCLFVFWHSCLLPLAFAHRGRDIAVLISQHRDGELIARIVERLGFATARGSSTRGAEGGTREMLRLAERGHALAIAPDGPRGPARVAKPGLVYLASRTGFPVIPTAAAASHGWRLASWDRFCIPGPMARLVVAHGAPITVPARLGDDQIEAWRARIEGALHDLNDEVEGHVGGRP